MRISDESPNNPAGGPGNPSATLVQDLPGGRRYRVEIGPDGSGCSLLEGPDSSIALTHRTAEGGRVREGLLFFVRDPETGRFRALGDDPGYLVCRNEPGLVILLDDRDGVAVRMEVTLAPGLPCEIRRLTLSNGTDAARRLEVTSLAEVVLNHPDAHASHPVFSKLFLQTEYVPGEGAGLLLVRRRPRGADESHPVLVHALVGPESPDSPGSAAGPVEWETDRARFFGRGRHPARPAALLSRAPLSGTVGNVLDPVVSLRRLVHLEPGASATLVFLLGVAADRGEAIDLVAGAGLCEAGRFPLKSVSNTPRITAEGETTKKAAPPGGAALQFFNGFGGFAAEAREYAIGLECRPDGTLRVPPCPWTNVLANEELGCIVSETGAGCTWSGNSREHRLTPWFNDPVLDPHGEALYLRDNRSGAYCSCLPGPIPAGGSYEMRHGLGYSRCLRTPDTGPLRDLEIETLVFVAKTDPVRAARIRVTNRGGSPRSLSLFAYDQLVLGGTPGETRPHVSTAFLPGPGLLIARNPAAGEFASRAAFAQAIVPGDAAVFHTGDRGDFLGPDLDPAVPFGLANGPIDGRTGRGLDPCFALQADLEAPPGATVEVTFLLGEASDPEAAAALAARWARPGAVEEQYRQVRDFWREGLDGIRVQTPSPALDLMVNGWLGYQTLACRIRGRSAFYQSGGAYGFRDQLQDSLSLTTLWPELTRRQIVLHAGHQFREGDVLHWWHPPLSRGIRTRFADDLLWLPFAVVDYVRATGDRSVLDEDAPFLQAPLLEPGQDEVFLEPLPSGESGTVYEHCCRALDRSLTLGAHGLPLFGTGDWNDGMNRVGREGRGESVWMGFFLAVIIDGFAPLCESRGDRERAARYRAHRATLIRNLNETGWDGAWYRRGYYDDGTPLGSSRDSECRIDALAQAWSVLSDVASPERADRVMDAVEEHLIDDEHRLIRLLTPPFVDTAHDPGYIKGYVAGVRENGGQYTHAALWVVRAMAKLGRRNRAAALLDLLNPVLHSATPEQVALYQVEPYVVAADVYGAEPHVGRGGWTWYTGSSGWMLRVALESVLGLQPEGDSLLLVPCVPDAWPGYTLTWRVPGSTGTRYEITVTNPDRCSERVVRAELDGAPLPLEGSGARAPLARDGRAHSIILVLGTRGE